MALNYIWIAFFLISFAVSLFKLFFFNDTQVFSAMVNSSFEMAKTGFEISLYLTGVMTLWLGIMKIGERGGMVNLLSKAVSPFFSKLFPEIPKNHPVNGSIMMNFAANMLGLDNAATPLGLKAMNELQELNPQKNTASNSQIMFLVLNASGLTIIPISIMVYRAQLGAANPSDIFIPILLSTFFSTLAGLISVSLFQKINLLQKNILIFLGGFTFLIGGVIWYFSQLPQEKINLVSTFSANFVLFLIIVSFIFLGVIKKINVYETFIEGAKDGFQVAVKVIPYLVAMLVGIGVFRASGGMDLIISGFARLCELAGINTDFVASLPTAFMKPLSGSGSRGLMIETMKNYGADSFAGRLACVFQGSTETTFYVLAVYYGAVSVVKTRYTLICGLIADLVGFIAAIFLSYLFFH